MIIVDRIEGNFAICYDEDDKIDISLELLPSEVKEGDVLLHGTDGYEIDKNETESRYKRIKKKADDLFI